MLPEIAPQNSNRIPDGTTAGTNFRLSIPLTPPPGVRFSTGRVCAFCSDTITQNNRIKPQLISLVASSLNTLNGPSRLRRGLSAFAIWPLGREIPVVIIVLGHKGQNHDSIE
jgi:hypothetical protein